ncbi:retrovirus-related pol polyprotein from transposon TNT 1-94 [Tanacetum coccineum]
MLGGSLPRPIPRKKDLAGLKIQQEESRTYSFGIVLRLFNKTYEGVAPAQEFPKTFIGIVRFGKDHLTILRSDLELHSGKHSFEYMMKFLLSPICLQSQTAPRQIMVLASVVLAPMELRYQINDLEKERTLFSRTPQQNGVVERRNRTLVEAVRTMMIFSKAPMFPWAKVVATACYTQNRSLIHTHHNKMPRAVHDKNLDPYFFFFPSLWCSCTATKDSEELGKLQPTDNWNFRWLCTKQKGL